MLDCDCLEGLLFASVHHNSELKKIKIWMKRRLSALIWGDLTKALN